MLFDIILQLVIWMGLVLALLILAVFWLVVTLFVLGLILQSIENRRVKKQLRKELSEL